VNYLAYGGYASSVVTVITAVLGPILGTLADTRGFKKPIFMLCLFVGVAGCCAMGLATTWMPFLIIFILAKIGFSGSLVFYDSMLGDVTTPERMDVVSSQGYAWGYIGSCVPFVVCLALVLGSEGIPLCLNAVQAGKVMAGIYQNWDAAAYAELCQKFGLPDKKQYRDYSTGMKMKLCIAVALAHHPKLLLLDEATNGLDPVVRDEVTDLLLDFARDENHSILISSHIVSDLEKLCDTIAFLHKGRLLLCEEKDALREEYALWHGTAAQLAALDAQVYGKRVTPYGVEALVRRDAMPAGAELAPVSIEELFILMVKGENVQ